MSAQAGEAHRRGHFTHEQIDDKQTTGGGAADLRDPRLRALFQTVPLQQANHRQRQQQNKRQVAGIKKSFSQLFQNGRDRHMRRQTRDDPGHNNHQYRVKTQNKSDHDRSNADQWPER